MNESLQEPLTGSTSGGDENGSQASQRSSSAASLLERIRAQRAQEQLQPSTTSGNLSAPTSTISVPQYNPVAQEQNFAGGGPAQGATETLSSNNFFSSAWTNISESMETGMASLQQEGYEITTDRQALMAPSATSGFGEENYSMTEYFMTFVNDVYMTFLALPVLVRVTVIFALLFTAFKLM